jgi:uncharacterized protein (TIGR00251 family)
MADAPGPVRAVPGGVRLTVHVQPRATPPGVAGRHGDALKVRVDAPPTDGRANERLIAIIAEALDVARRDVSLVSGEASRHKVLEIAGRDVADVVRRLGL